MGKSSKVRVAVDQLRTTAQLIIKLTPVQLKSSKLGKLKLPELKNLCRQHKLKVSGKKLELATRLAEAGMNPVDLKMGETAVEIVPMDTSSETSSTESSAISTSSLSSVASTEIATSATEQSSASSSSSSSSTSSSSSSSSPASAAPVASKWTAPKNLGKHTVDQLRTMCVARGLSSTGVRAYLEARLKCPPELVSDPTLQLTTAMLNQLSVTQLKALCQLRYIEAKGADKQKLLLLLTKPVGTAPLRSIRTLADVDLYLASQGVDRLDEVSMCLKVGIKKGHISLSEGLDTLVMRGTCLLCSGELLPTVRTILYQPDYGGDDYEEHGMEAPLKCKNEKCNDFGMYVTDICCGRPSIDSGKFHNHCKKHKDGGKCIGDYREVHCDSCGSHHWYSNECSNCNKRRGSVIVSRSYGGGAHGMNSMFALAMVYQMVTGKSPYADSSDEDDFYY